MTVCMEYPAIVRIQASELLVPFSLDADINTAILRTIQPMYPEYVHRVQQSWILSSNLLSRVLLSRTGK